MDAEGLRQCTPVNLDPSVTIEPFVNMHSGYIQRVLDRVPRQGSKAPWRLYMNYALDLVALRYRSVEDEAMQFSNPPQAKKKAAPKRQTAVAAA